MALPRSSWGKVIHPAAKIVSMSVNKNFLVEIDCSSVDAIRKQKIIEKMTKSVSANAVQDVIAEAASHVYEMNSLKGEYDCSDVTFCLRSNLPGVRYQMNFELISL